jgi:AraC-like DNA-binding protein
MDALSAVLRDLRLEGAGYRRFELGAPWSVAFRQADLRGIHIVLEGRCEVVVEGGSAEPLGPGDLVVLPRADPHILRSPGRRAAAVDSFALAGTPGTIRHGGAGERAAILCGAFLFHEADRAMLEAMPHVIRIESGKTAGWLGPYIEAIGAEAGEDRAGADIVMARLSDALVARALRHYTESAGSTGWLRGLGDAHIARALGAMHGEYGRDWTLLALARLAGLSRAAFAARFAALVGLPPMQYLTQVRLRRAMLMLGKERASLARTAEAIGYGSEAAFSNAFKRWTGQSPGAYRRQTPREE